MRYWAYFAAKAGVAGAVLYGLLQLLDLLWPENPDLGFGPPRFVYDLPYTLAVMLWFLLCCGVGYAVVRDQRYRCRVCLRRLRMPVATGSWSRMLQFGRPRIEYICPYGHGTLKREEVQILGLETPQWDPHSNDLWEELCAASKESDHRS
ncbi:MAG: hypothetical protein C5B51_23115 [Terriglobia bacterium]|nr:MAG: hypothetical protein C5B51_23115 [Terriglobia bacterium]